MEAVSPNQLATEGQTCPSSIPIVSPIANVTVQPPAGQQDDNVLMDFTTMFKKGVTRKPSRPLVDKQQENKPAVSNWLLEIPTKLALTMDDLKQRKVFDTKRWNCLVKVREEKLSGVAAVVSCWNYLCSKVGVGKLQPLSIKAALEMFQADSKLTQLDAASAASNEQICQLFKQLCSRFGTQSTVRSVIHKPGTADYSSNQLSDTIKKNIKSERHCFIYHCLDHFLCVIGYQLTPNRPLEAYKKLQEIAQGEAQLWLILGETVRDQPVLHVKKWKVHKQLIQEIETDLETSWPLYFDIRESGKGQQRYPSATELNEKEVRTTPRCFIEFELPADV